LLKKKHKRVIIAIIVLVCIPVLITLLRLEALMQSGSLRQAQRQEHEMMEAIPEAVAFFEDNILFFELLLDVQEKARDRMYVLVEEEGQIYDQWEVRLNAYNNPLSVVIGVDGNTQWVQLNDFFSYEERQLLLSTLQGRLTSPNGNNMSVRITEDCISVSFFTFHRATLRFVSPALGTELRVMNDRLLEYAKVITDDWCVYIHNPL